MAGLSFKRAVTPLSRSGTRRPRPIRTTVTTRKVWPRRTFARTWIYAKLRYVTAITHLRDLLGAQIDESLANYGKTMTTAEMVTYASDQIDQARSELNAISVSFCVAVVAF